MQVKIFLISIFFNFFVYFSNAKTCNNVGALQVFYDPTCVNGGIGCNAAGQENCRFCGFDVFPPCPTKDQETTKKATTSKVTKTPTQPKTKTTRSTKEPNTGGPTPDTSSGSGSDSGNNNNNQGECKCGSNSEDKNKFIIGEGENEFNEYGERLIFFDDFDTFNFKIWKHDITLSGGGNWEFQLYHNNRTNSFVEDGVLNIWPTLTGDRIGENNLRSNYRMDLWGGSPADRCTGNMFYGCERTAGAGGNIINPIQSAKITTSESFAFKYGRVEVRAKLPVGDWLWPAIWLLPEVNQYGGWPASGEIDIMESKGNGVNYPISAEGGVDCFGSTLHWGTDWSQNRFRLTHEFYQHSEPLSDDFHTYGLYWTEERLYTYIDDPSNIVMDVDFTQEDFFTKGKFADSYENPWKGNPNMHAPFDKEFYLIINLAVGGTAGYFPNGAGGKPWSDQSQNSVNEFYAAKAQWYPTWKQSFQIDWVKVWSL